MFQHPRRIDPVEAGHVQVHQDDVRVELLCDGDALERVAGRAEWLDAVIGGEREQKRLREHRMVVDDENANSMTGIVWRHVLLLDW
jgi:hypothetical protein